MADQLNIQRQMTKSVYVVEDEIAGTRQHANALRQEIVSQLAQLATDRFEIDLSNVTSMSGAFADELAGRLLAEHLVAARRIVFVTGNDRVRNKLHLALSRRGPVGWVRMPHDLHPGVVGAVIAGA